jgi:hypothetical protein
VGAFSRFHRPRAAQAGDSAAAAGGVAAAMRTRRCVSIQVARPQAKSPVPTTARGGSARGPSGRIRDTGAKPGCVASRQRGDRRQFSSVSALCRRERRAAGATVAHRHVDYEADTIA